MNDRDTKAYTDANPGVKIMTAMLVNSPDSWALMIGETMADGIFHTTRVVIDSAAVSDAMATLDNLRAYYNAPMGTHP